MRSTSAVTATLRASVTSARAHLDDLQAQIEAGQRCAERIHFDARTIDLRVERHYRQSARLESLAKCAAELRASIAEQRSILRELQASVSCMRRALRERRTGMVESIAGTAPLPAAPATDTVRASGPEKARARSPRRPAPH